MTTHFTGEFYPCCTVMRAMLVYILSPTGEVLTVFGVCTSQHDITFLHRRHITVITIYDKSNRGAVVLCALQY